MRASKTEKPSASSRKIDVMRLAFCLLVVVSVVESVRRLPFLERAHTLVSTARRAQHVLSSKRISDHWKEKVLLRYAGRMAFSSLLLGAMLGLVVALVSLIGLVTDYLAPSSPSSMDYLFSSEGLLAATSIAVVYWFGRSKLVR